MSDDRIFENAQDIPYDKPADAFRSGEFFGLAQAVEMLKAIPSPMRDTPGMGLALAKVEAMMMTARGNEAIRALRFAARHGVDINTHLIAGGPKGYQVAPMDLDDLANLPA